MTTTEPVTTCRPCHHRPTPDLRWRRILTWTVPPALVGLLLFSVEATLILAGAALILFTAVVLHEAGHLVAARRAGAAVTEFAVGFGPVLAVRHARGLDWSLRAVPLGGFCHVVGQDESDALCPEHAPQFPGVPMHRTRYRHQMAVALSGVGMNMAAAWFLLAPVVAYMIHVMGDGSVPQWKAILLAAGITTLTVAVAPLMTYIAIGAYVAAIPASGWTDNMGSILMLPTQMDSMVDTGAGADLPPVQVLLLVAAGIHLSLAALNALPLFPLDGFHAAAIAVRRFRGGRKLPERAVTVMAAVTAAPLAVFVIGLAVKDIVSMAT